MSVDSGHRVADSVEAFLAEEPWPAELSDRGPALHWVWTFELPEASPEALWPLVSDTSRINRELALASMTFEERDGVRHGRAVHGGLRHEWIEPPWDWEAPRRLSVVRKYSRGWAHYVRSIYRLEPSGDGTRMTVYFGWVPRGFIGRWAIKAGMSGFDKPYGKVLRDLAVRAAEPAPEPLRMAPPPLPTEVLTRVEALSAELAQSAGDPELAARVADLARTGDDLDVVRLRPKALARQWECDDRQVLITFLHATRLGMLELSWDVVCPLCRGPRAELGSLADVPQVGQCDICHAQFTTESSHSVEITFRIHGSIRDVQKVFFCSAEPSHKQHVRVQARVEPGEERVLRPVLRPGRYRLRPLEDGDVRRTLTVEEGGGSELTLDVRLADDFGCGPNPTLTLVNRSDQARTLIIEEVEETDEALLPAELFTLQAFRDLFTEEYIARDIRLAVGRQTILFTDIVGSTRFYAQVGDPDAFVAVRRHFDSLWSIIESHRGAVVKTIGDAVMAAFPDSVDAVRASRAIHDEFNGDKGPIRLRISLHAGPCIAVNLNSTIDFFGSSVNLAAKLQACAEAGEIAMSDAVYGAPGVADYLQDRGAKLEAMTFEIAALGRQVPVTRWLEH